MWTLEVAEVLRLAPPAMWWFCSPDEPPHLPAPTDSVDLMDTSGRLMNLQEKQDSMESAGSLLVERRHYVLLRLRSESTIRQHTLCFYCERLVNPLVSCRGRRSSSSSSAVCSSAGQCILQPPGVRRYKPRPQMHIHTSLQQEVLL